ncbi:type II toxin-antitoxin system HicB family antitoxin [Pleurocapsa sp. PCC 7319]|uniref:type II toxin-antitoxin system HicB family antitoxin n=1 Tax=Pleurocapsa sp. PCC 7319 TaxID=118161 RepID=UPI000348ED17|nr:type II toxin-antitoxin system HicB family antitoxin [Pleurocapsa sp. PCC 7319]
MKSRYSIVIQWSNEDECYIVSLPEFGKYARTHGDTYEEAVKNAQEVLELLIEDNNNLPQPNIYESEAIAN